MGFIDVYSNYIGLYCFIWYSGVYVSKWYGGSMGKDWCELMLSICAMVCVY